MPIEKNSSSSIEKTDRSFATQALGWALVAGVAVGGLLAFAVGCVFNGAEGVKKGLNHDEEEGQGQGRKAQGRGGEAVHVEGRHTVGARKPAKPVPPAPPAEPDPVDEDGSEAPSGA